MSGQHTKGPWSVNPRATTHVEANNGRQIRGVASCGGYFDTTSNGAWAAENEANARLIAAAPCLLEALRWAEENAEASEASRDDDWYSGLDRVRAAIAKATGGAA